MKYLLAISAAVFIYCLLRSGLGAKDDEKRQIQKRLNNIKKLRRSQVDSEDEKKNGWKVNLSWIRIPVRIEQDLMTSGIKISPQEFAALWGMAVFVLPVLLLMVGMGFLICFGAAVAGALLPPVLVRGVRKKRVEKFQNQLGETLLILSNTIRAGLTFERALLTIAEGLPVPISEELLRTGGEIQVGASIETAMDDLAERMQNEDLKLVTSAVLIQKRVGGNLADILEIISGTVKDRIEIKRKIKTLTAQGRVSAQVVGILPLGLIGIISMSTPSYMVPLFTTSLGITLLVIAAVLEVIGFFIMMKMTDINY